MANSQRKVHSMKYGKLNLGQIEAIVNKLGGEEGVEMFLRGLFDVTVKVTNFVAQTLNYDLSIKDLVKGYDKKIDRLNDVEFYSTENEKKKSGKKMVEFALFHFVEDMTSEKVILEMMKWGYRPATIKELLFFGNKNPELQRRLRIIALGTVADFHSGVNSCKRVGLLCGDENERNAYMDMYERDWSGSDRSGVTNYQFRFLAVRL